MATDDRAGAGDIGRNEIFRGRQAVMRLYALRTNRSLDYCDVTEP